MNPPVAVRIMAGINPPIAAVDMITVNSVNTKKVIVVVVDIMDISMVKITYIN
jgi:hypothetical protein